MFSRPACGFSHFSHPQTQSLNGSMPFIPFTCAISWFEWKKCTARWKEGTEETSNSKKSLHWFFNVLIELKSNAVSLQYSFSDTKNVCIILLKYTRELSSPGLRWITVNRQKTRNQTSTIYCSQTGKFLIFNGVTAAPCFRELNHLIWS